MRQIDLYLDRPNGQFVQGINAANPVAALRVAQNEKLDIRIHNAVRNTAVPALTPFVERPLDFSSIRASIGNIDQAPRSGSFKLRISGQTTAQINWTSPTTPSAVTAFKATVLAALHALSNVEPAELIAVDPPDSPAHILYFQWTNARTDEIEVVDVKLLPWIAPLVTPGQTAAGYTQSVKLSQAPFVIATEFEREDAPLATVVETRPGATGTNAEQTLIIPAAAMGSLSLSWDGATTKTMAAGTVTAASIAAALNAIVASGATAPRFRVEERPARDARRFAIEFIGALAGASQPMLTVAAHDQEPLLYARGLVSLEDNLGIEQSLNGAASVTLKFELVINDADGPAKFIVPIEIVNDMTSAGTLASLEEIGAVLTVTREVFVDLGTAEAFADVAAGSAYTLPTGAVSSSFVIPRTFNDKHPDVSASYRTSAPGDPEVWIDYDDNLYTATHTSETSTTVSLLKADGTARPVNIADPAHADYATRYKFFFAARDTRVMLFTHKHTWDDVLDTLPAGQSLRAKLAALEAAIAQVGGGLQIPPSSLDLPGLVTALSALVAINPAVRAAFVDLLSTLIADSTLIRAIAKELAKYEEFFAALKTAFENEDVLKTLSEKLLACVDFAAELRAMVIGALQGGAGTLPPGTVLFVIPPWEFIFPPPQEIPAPSVVTESIEAVETTQLAGDTTTKTSGNQTVSKTQAQTTVRYDLLSPAIFAPANGGNVSGLLSPTATAGQKYTATAAVNARTVSTRRGRDWKNGTILTRQNGHWYDVRVATSVAGETLWPVEMEDESFRCDITADMLRVGTRFASAWLLQAALEGNATGKIDLIVERGWAVDGAGVGHNLTWTPVFTQRIPLTPTLALHQFGVEIERRNVTTSATRDFVGSSGATEFTMDTRGLVTGMTVTGTDFPPGTTLEVFDLDTENGTVFTSQGKLSSGTNTCVCSIATPQQFGTYTRYGASTTFEVPSAAFALRVRVANFDCEDTWLSGVDARGCMKLKILNASASIAPL
jgi:hypothetical protein